MRNTAVLFSVASCILSYCPLTFARPNSGVSNDGASFDNEVFDYVVVGGGLAGLVVATRLSEDNSKTVAVIEAGQSEYGNNNILIPSGNLYASSLNTERDWQYQTTPQRGLAGRTTPWNRGKLLGGSSAINGLYLVRPNQIEQDAWASLLRDNGAEAEARWRWDNVMNAMRKSETFLPNDGQIMHTLAQGDPGYQGAFLPYRSSSHGTDGPINHAWPGVTFEDVGAWLSSASKVMGLPINEDPYSGRNQGPFLSLSALNPRDWTRSFSRNAYLDPALARNNLFVLTNNQATKILFDASSTPVRATGVQFAPGPNQPVHTVHARREVILAGGAVGSPQLLQLSGVADKSVLDPLGIKQVADVPGVGFHIQDHVLTELSWSPKPGTVLPVTAITGDKVQDSYVNSAVGFIPISKIAGDQGGLDEIIARVRGAADELGNRGDVPETVRAGMKATVLTLANQVYSSDMPGIEVLFENWYGRISIQCALQHTVSRGTLKIRSNNAFEPPAIDPDYLGNDVDLKIMRAGSRLARSIAETAPLSNYVADELSPGKGVQSDDQWNDWLRQTSGSEFHTSSGCSMLPFGLGGVVDHNFLVYNTQNLRVVDSSTVPMTMSEHLMATTYGLAETGAQVIKASGN